MIPENIKIDENGDFEIEAYHPNVGDVYKYFTFEQIEEAYLLAKSKKYPETVIYGCHVDSDKSKVYDDCELDFCTYSLACPFAIELKKQGKCKTDCQYWRVVEVKK